MATPTLSPASNTSVSKLSSTGTHASVASSLAYGIYSSAAFVSGAADQVAYTYQKLGGDILDIEDGILNKIPGAWVEIKLCPRRAHYRWPACNRRH